MKFETFLRRGVYMVSILGNFFHLRFAIESYHMPNIDYFFINHKLPVSITSIKLNCLYVLRIFKEDFYRRYIGSVLACVYEKVAFLYDVFGDMPMKYTFYIL